MKTPSLVFRMALQQQALAAALIVVFSASALWLTDRTIERGENASLLMTASRLAAAIEREWHEEHDLRRGALAALAEDGPSGVAIEVLDAHGAVVVAAAQSHASRMDEALRTARQPIPGGGWVVASSSRAPHRRALRALGMALLLTGIPLFVAVSAASRALARRALRPLSRIAQEAEAASGSGGVTPLGRAGDPAEVVLLSDAFNRLLDRLDQTLQSERQFTQDAAHELRTPLTVVSGELEFALASPELADRHRPGLLSAQERVGSMGELVEALLLLRRSNPIPAGERDEFVPVNLGDLVRETSRDLLLRAPERAADVAIESEDEVLVAGHAVLLGSAIRNLLSNAFKFTRAGQRVEIRVSAEDGACVLIVDDAGPGLPTEQRERVFDAFYRDPESRATHDGAGLGLHILREVVRAHGGEVIADNSVLGGARFELRLPAWTPRS